VASPIDDPFEERNPESRPDEDSGADDVHNIEDEVGTHSTISRRSRPGRAARYSSTQSRPIQGIAPDRSCTLPQSFLVSATAAPHGTYGPWLFCTTRFQVIRSGLPSRPNPVSRTNMPPLWLTRGSIHRLRRLSGAAKGVALGRTRALTSRAKVHTTKCPRSPANPASK